MKMPSIISLTFAAFIAIIITIIININIKAECKDIFNRTSSCDPLVPEMCIFPYPSSFYEIPSSSSSSSITGIELLLDAESLPLDLQGSAIDPFAAGYNGLDGWSVFPAIMTYFEDLSVSNLPPHWDAIASLDEDCVTVLFDVTNGERVAHFAEVDRSMPLSSKNALMIWPLQTLHFNHRYIVAIRNLVRNNGLPVSVSQGFLALRDNVASSDPDIEGRRGLFEEIFSILEENDIDRNSLQIAWDFHTMSSNEARSRLTFMRDDAFARVGGDDGPSYQITSVVDDYSEHTYRRIQGVFQAPGYCNTPNCDPGSFLVIDPITKNPVYGGLVNVTFTLMIPRSAISNPPGRIVTVGHGLFGSQDTVEQTFQQELANRLQWGAMIAVDWWGMCSDDIPPITEMLLTDMTNAKMIPDRSSQGMINMLLVTRLAKGRLSQDPITLGSMDSSQLGYIGNSQGGIFGLVYMAMSQDVIYGNLGVPGLPYSLMLPRSVDFTPFDAIIKQRYPDPLDHALLICFLQNIWDRTDPDSYAPLLREQTHKSVTVQYSLGDAEVHYLSAYALGRSIGAQFFTEHVVHGDEILFGFEFLQGSQRNQSMMIGYAYEGVPDSPLENTPPPSTYNTHSYVRREILAQDQIETLFENGYIENNCDGPCFRDEPPTTRSHHHRTRNLGRK